MWEGPSIPESLEPHPKHDIRLSLYLPWGLSILCEAPLPCPNQHPDAWQTSHPTLLSWMLLCPWKPDHFLIHSRAVPKSKGRDSVFHHTLQSLRPFSEISELREIWTWREEPCLLVALPLNSVTLGGLLSLSEPYFPYLWNGNNLSPACLIEFSWCSVAQTGGRCFINRGSVKKFKAQWPWHRRWGYRHFWACRCFWLGLCQGCDYWDLSGEQAFMRWGWLGISLVTTAWSLCPCHLLAPLFQKYLQVSPRAPRFLLNPDTRGPAMSVSYNSLPLPAPPQTPIQLN